MELREGQTGTAPDGTRVIVRGGRIVPLVANPSAPGFQYLPQAPEGPNKSEDAYYREWRTKDPTAGNQAVGQARAMAGMARRAEGLLARQKTGGLYGIPVVGNVLGFMDPEIRELDAIQARVARQERQPGEGAISDFDAQQFLAMTYGKDKPTETNRALIQAQRVAADAPIQRRQFGEWYRQRFGTLSGFEEAWDRYSQDNPIFDTQSEAVGTPTLNARRMEWREYFGAGGDARPSQVTGDIRRAAKKPGGPIQSRIPPTGLTPAQRKAAARFRGTRGNSGTDANPSIPVNEQQYNALPSGTVYIHPDGSIKRKP
jgi:hypothetical protein